MGHVTRWLWSTQRKPQLAKIGSHCPSEGRDKKISWSHDQWVIWLGGWDAFNLNHKGYSKSNRTQRQKDICITNWGKLVLQIGAALFYYKLGQTLLQIGAASLLQIGASVVTNWSSYYKLGQPLLQNRAAITNWSITLVQYWWNIVVKLKVKKWSFSKWISN